MIIGLQIGKLHGGADFAPPLVLPDSEKPGLFRVEVTGIRPMAPLQNRGPLEDIWTQNV